VTEPSTVPARGAGRAFHPATGALALAWGVHLFTAAGAVVGVLAIIAIGEGRLRPAIFLMAAAFFIDAVDGALARKVGVSRLLPRFDGRRLDDLIDFLNYVIVPACFMHAAGTLSHWSLIALPILASCYGFCQVDAKTEDNFFLGFPSLWNVVAAYAFGLGLSATAGSLWVGFLSVLTFVPLKYAYPSRLRVLRRTTIGLGIVWAILMLTSFAAPEGLAGLPLLEVSLFFPVYYFALGFWLGHGPGARR
jgi:phosphatidylcholine synthase